MPADTASPAAPLPVRLRRMLDPSLLERAYGRGVHDRVPVEIIDLDDETRLCEWDDGRRERYASEADMWRDLHALAKTRDVPRSVPYYAARAWASSQTMVTPDLNAADEKRHAHADAMRDIAALEPIAGLDVKGGAREAWVDREVALLAVVLDDDELEMPSRFPRWVAIPGEADDRALDTLGRRNGRGRHEQAASRTLPV